LLKLLTETLLAFSPRIQ